MASSSKRVGAIVPLRLFQGGDRTGRPIPLPLNVHHLRGDQALSRKSPAFANFNPPDGGSKLTVI